MVRMLLRYRKQVKKHVTLKETAGPQYLSNYISDVEPDDQMMTNIDYCCFKEAMSSAKSDIWAKAKDEEMDSLRETHLPVYSTRRKTCSGG